MCGESPETVEVEYWLWTHKDDPDVCADISDMASRIAREDLSP